MTGWLLILLIINTLIALGYLLWGLLRPGAEKKSKKEKEKYVLLSVFIFLCPLTGVCFLSFSHLLYLTLSTKNVDMNEISFSRKRAKRFEEADVEREINIAPMQEVLIVSDVKRRRKMLLDVAKRDVRKSLGTIAIALENSDSETSHYAASLIMDALSEFRGTVQNMLVQLKKDPSDHDLSLLLFQYIYEVLRQGVFSSEENRSYTYTLEEVAATVFLYNKNALDGKHYRHIIEALVDAGDYPLADRWAQRALEYRGYQLDPYIGCLKLYYTYGDREAFFQCIRQLEESGIAVTKEMMELIRIFRVQA